MGAGADETVQGSPRAIDEGDVRRRHADDLHGGVDHVPEGAPLFAQRRDLRREATETLQPPAHRRGSQRGAATRFFPADPASSHSTLPRSTGGYGRRYGFFYPAPGGLSTGITRDHPNIRIFTGHFLIPGHALFRMRLLTGETFDRTAAQAALASVSASCGTAPRRSPGPVDSLLRARRPLPRASAARRRGGVAPLSAGAPGASRPHPRLTAVSLSV